MHKDESWCRKLSPRPDWANWWGNQINSRTQQTYQHGLRIHFLQRSKLCEWHNGGDWSGKVKPGWRQEICETWNSRLASGESISSSWHNLGGYLKCFERRRCLETNISSFCGDFGFFNLFLSGCCDRWVRLRRETLGAVGCIILLSIGYGFLDAICVSVDYLLVHILGNHMQKVG